MCDSVLIVSATTNEAALVIKSMSGVETSPGVYGGVLAGRPVELLIGGIGAVAMTFRLTQLLSRRSCRFAMSMGIAGAFAGDIAIGEVVQITDDCFSDLGIDDRGVFRSLSEAGLTGADEFPFNAGQIVNPLPMRSPYREVSGITVQTASGSEQAINKLVERYHPQVETMENAAFFYVCRMMQVPFASFRAISNRVEPRNRKIWQIKQAIGQVSTTICHQLSHMD